MPIEELEIRRRKMNMAAIARVIPADGNPPLQVRVRAQTLEEHREGFMFTGGKHKTGTKGVLAIERAVAQNRNSFAVPGAEQDTAHFHATPFQAVEAGHDVPLEVN
jgi:hypothetical protein